MEKRKKMKKWVEVSLFLLAIVILLLLVYYFLIDKESFPVIVKGVVGQGDEVYDARKPADACNSIAESFQYRECRLIDAKRVDSGKVDEETLGRDCLGLATVAGCFSCTFECSGLEK
jgi:hypothetical protein